MAGHTPLLNVCHDGSVWEGVGVGKGPPYERLVGTDGVATEAEPLRLPSHLQRRDGASQHRLSDTFIIFVTRSVRIKQRHNCLKPPSGVKLLSSARARTQEICRRYLIIRYFVAHGDLISIILLIC